MHVFRNFSICVALVSMAAFTITGCCSGNCGLLGGGAGSAVPSHSGGSCSTCGTGGSYSSPTQSFASPTYAAPTESYSTQGFSTQQFSNSVPTSAGSGSVNLPSVQDQFQFHQSAAQAVASSTTYPTRALTIKT